MKICTFKIKGGLRNMYDYMLREVHISGCKPITLTIEAKEGKTKEQSPSKQNLPKRSLMLRCIRRVAGKDVSVGINQCEDGKVVTFVFTRVNATCHWNALAAALHVVTRLVTEAEKVA